MTARFFRLAIGSFSHISVVDILRKVCVFCMNTAVVLRSIDKKIQLKSPNAPKPGKFLTSKHSLVQSFAGLTSLSDCGARDLFYNINMFSLFFEKLLLK